MSKYDLRLSLLGDQQAQDMAFLKKLGAQQVAQNFIASYMAPNEVSDLYNRLGTVIASTPDTTTVSDRSFPPFNLDSIHAGLGVRVGGFKSLNDKINTIQNVYRLLSGEIRTKITEWDISLYLQELWITDVSMFDLSLLYRIFTDNPSRYTDSKTLAYGLLNAALSYQYNTTAFNPSADPDLIYWVPPTDSLGDYQVTPRGHMVNTSSGWWIFARHSSHWVWDVPPPPNINAWQQNQISIVTANGWGSWYPPLWKLFFTSSNPAAIGADDFPAIIQRLEALSAARHMSAPAPQVQPGASSSLFTAPGAPPCQTGINITSPIWYGYPYGRNPDPRSIQGYINNTDGSTSKVDVSSSPITNINLNYPYGNPTDGINKLLNGWTSSFNYTTYVQELTFVYNPQPWWGNNSGGRWNGDSGFYTPQIITVPKTVTESVSGFFPTVAGIIGVPSSKERAITQKVFEFETVNNSDGHGSTQTQKWGTQESDQVINPETVLQINFLTDTVPHGTSAVAVDTILSDYAAKPVILVGTKQGPSSNPSFVIIAPIQKVQAITYSSHTAHFLWWSWNVVTTHKKWVYQLDMTHGQGFSINTESQNTMVAMPHLPLQYFARGAWFTGVYFNLPKRSLGASDNIITDGWTAVGIDPTIGAAIATALLNPMWWNGTVYNRSPFHRILDVLVSNVFSVIANTLDTLSTLFSSSSGAVIENLISQFPTDIQNKATIQTAASLFSDSSIGSALSQVENLQASVTSLLAAINNIRAGRGTYHVGDIQTFAALYPIVMGGLLSSTMLNAMRSYLDVLYEQRILIASARINKQNGTLLNAARTEFVLGLMQDSMAASSNPAAPLIHCKLAVVHSVTNLSLMDKATTATAGDLAAEKIRLVYVPVQYTDKGEVVRPPFGTYQLFSQEIINNTAVTPAEWYITFEKNDPNCPNIIKNVITTLDGQKLQQIMLDTSLTQLEKVCYARSLEDWWEIPVPASSQPLVSFYQTSLQLILAAPDSFIEQYIAMTGDLTLNPILDSKTQIQIGSTWAADPAAQNQLKALQGDK